ncbi:PEP-CTERM sorting domain-containing protein [Algisphaera agarilytica]|uniref:PEP-CTERM protein-sorting domain-containing protein n=1 Tax=Algisphaera agarilytica TaxID=1385975 RepID=A0A7X0H963_9BACT|nr:PEP-CTERM sorting domain-containing protein [Algisphaera agarilytica]MBB6431585.1 hypothetical protein [Algisphaera agarilytica]
MKYWVWTLCCCGLSLNTMHVEALEYTFASPLVDINDFVISGTPADVVGSFETSFNPTTNSEIRTVLEFDISRRPRFGQVIGRQLYLDPGGATFSGTVGGRLALYSRVGNGVAEAADADTPPSSTAVFSGITDPIPYNLAPFSTDLIQVNSIFNGANPYIAVSTFALDFNRNVSLPDTASTDIFDEPRIDTVIQLPDSGTLNLGAYSDAQFQRSLVDSPSPWRLAAGVDPLKVQRSAGGLESRAQLEFDLRDVPARDRAHLLSATLSLDTVDFTPADGAEAAHFEVYAFEGGDPISAATAGVAEQYNLQLGEFSLDSTEPVAVDLAPAFLELLANFSVLRLEILETGSGASFEFSADASTLALAYRARRDPFLVAGDYNGNGVVDAADYTVWQDSFGSTADLRADGNDNGVVDAADYTLWQDNFGAESAAAAGTVPEPSTLGFVGVLAGGLLTARRKNLKP